MKISSDFHPFVETLASATDLLKGRVSQARLTETALQIVKRRSVSRSRVSTASLSEPEKRRYIVAAPLYQQAAGATVQANLRSIHETLKNNIVRSHQETGPKVLNLSRLEAAVLKERFPALLVEEDVQYRLARSPLVGPIDPISVPAAAARSVSIEVKGGGHPLPEARVVLYSDVAHRAGYEGHTDSSGRLNLSVRSSDAVFEKIVVLPKAGFWSRVKKGESVASSMVFSLDPLPVNGFDWGLNATDAASRGGHRGKGVKVAIVDSGIAPHPSLAVFGGKNFIDGESEGAWQDLDGHGTHCAGVVAALDAVASVWGYAPKVELYALRVFGGVDGGGYASDIGDAIEWAIQAGCDVISMSLGSATASSYIRSKIEKATDAGTLCVAATGNEAGDVSYPAKFRNVVGVAAVGKAGTFPEDSIHADAKSNFKSSDSHYFLASFSNRGDDVDLCAPGVAVTSTLPTDTFGAWDGTSMACPHVAGIAALALEASPIIQQAARDAGRMGLLFDRVLGLCTDLGMAKAHQGSGLPRLSGVFTP